jgi:rare lipoprotein A
MLPLRFACLCLILAAAPVGPSQAAEPPAARHEQVASWRVSIAPTAHAGLHALSGIASFYWQGEQTASGEPFDKAALTAAHRTLPFNTRVRVTNPRTRRSVVVRINDRGPFTPGRIIDLSDAAAAELGMRDQGLARVVLEVLE